MALFNCSLHCVLRCERGSLRKQQMASRIKLRNIKIT